MRKTIFPIFTLLLLGAMLFPGCSENPEHGDPSTVKTYTMTVVAEKGEIVAKALNVEGNTLKASWTMGEKVYVYNKTRSANVDGYLEAQGNGASTTLKGTLTGAIDTNDELVLKFLDPDYGTQEGTLEYIAAHCNYATATVTVKSVANDKITTAASASFTNQQAIVEFTFSESDGTALASGISSLLVNAGGTDITVKPVSASDILYIAVPALSNGTIRLKAVDLNGAPRSYEMAGETFENGQFYKKAVKLDCIVSDEAELRASALSEVPKIIIGSDITLKAGQITISGAPTIDLAGHTISGNNNSRIFNIPAERSLTLLDSGTGGTLTDGYDSSQGGAIYNAGILTIMGGTISGNVARYGGGIYQANGAHAALIISGNPVISDNTGGNVYLASTSVITVNGAFTASASIGVTLADRAGSITSGYSAYNGSLDPAGVFLSDDNAASISLRDGEAELALLCRYEVTAEKTYDNLQALLEETGHDLSAAQSLLPIVFPESDTPVRAISYTYDSMDPQGNPVKLSALVYVPCSAMERMKALTGICLSNHGTIASNAECPTMRAQFEGALAWKNFAIVMPDYYGFGGSADRPQAYLDAETTARGSIDAYLAAVHLLEDREVDIPDQLYSFGYSQGGFNSMANLKYVSEHPGLNIRFERVICGGSPFDVELTWNEYINGAFRNSIAFVPMTLVSINETQQLHIDYGNLFKDKLLANWEDWILSKTHTTSEISKLLGTHDLSDILNDDFMAGRGDAFSAVLRVCQRYSLTRGWTPPTGTKIILFHSEQDDTVPFTNLAAMKTFLKSVGVNTNNPNRYREYKGKYGGHVDAVLRFFRFTINEFD